MHTIQVPCDWKIVDLLTTQNANDFGEALRGHCFIGRLSETGYYSTFRVHESFKKVTEGVIFDEAKKYLYDEVKATVYHFKLEEKDCYLSYEHDGKIEKTKVCEPFEIVMGWAWDGDGSLYFRFNDRKVVNTDCKKNYIWEWAK